jgi:hypothetical protein
MPEKTETYRNHDITVEETDDRVVVRVDGTRLDIAKLEDGSYVTPYLPYVSFDDLDRLTHNIVDNWAYIAPVVHEKPGDQEDA